MQALRGAGLLPPSVKLADEQGMHNLENPPRQGRSGGFILIHSKLRVCTRSYLCDFVIIKTTLQSSRKQDSCRGPTQIQTKPETWLVAVTERVRPS